MNNNTTIEINPKEILEQLRTPHSLMKDGQEILEAHFLQQIEAHLKEQKPRAPYPALAKFLCTKRLTALWCFLIRRIKQLFL